MLTKKAEEQPQEQPRQNKVQQQKTSNKGKNAVQTKMGKEPPIQAKHRGGYPTKEGQKGNIAARHHPVQRNQKSTGKPETDTGLKSLMGNQYGVDLSGYKEHQNSSFPGSMGALATIQGKNIHYAPGQFTEKNRKHELGHAIDNTIHGTPKGDTAINGQSVDTTREAAADKIMNTPLQRKSNNAEQEKEPSTTNTALQMQHSNQVAPASQLTGNFGVIQLKGVGGSKIAFEKRVAQQQQAVISAGMVLLKAAWKEARGLRKAEKKRIGKDMAAYDKAMTDGDQETINRLERENDRRNRPLLYQAKDVADAALQGHLDRINDLKSQIFHDEKSAGIFGQQHYLDALPANIQPAQQQQIGKAIGQIMRDQRMRALNQQTRALKQATTLADNNLQQDVQQNPKSGGLTQVYFDSITSQIPEEEDLLQSTTSFQDGTLSLANNEVTYQGVVIADLRKGLAAYAQSQGQPTASKPRQVYHKKGMEDVKTKDGSQKEYVKDSRGAMTRRYAYVEKNYYQMMEFFMVGHMTGRFQQYMMAGATSKPNVHKFTTQMIQNVPLVQPNAQAQMTDTQVAVAHQMYGSLSEQRGVSLTATPKIGVTYANTGGNFRTNDGFKLKIDLARVPEEVLFLNHYGEGGVSDMNLPDYSTLQSHKPNPYNYKYEESAAHARELFIEHISPEWVVEIEHHQKGGFKDRKGRKTIMKEEDHEDLLGAAKTALGGDAYEKGYEVTIGQKEEDEALQNDANYQKGKGTAKMVRTGYAKGVEVKQARGVTNSDVAFREVMTDNTIQDEMSPYHIGYMQGRTGQAIVKSIMELKMLLSAGLKLSDPSDINGSFSIFDDRDNLVIKRVFKAQMGQKKTSVTTIPFSELKNARIVYEKDEGNVDIVIEKKSGDYALVLSEQQAEIFKNHISHYLNKSSRLTTTKSTPKGDSYALCFDAKQLKISREYFTQMNMKRLKNSTIVLADISEVEFERQGAKVQVNIAHESGDYTISVTPDWAIQVRQLLIRSGVDPKNIGTVPEE